MICPGCLQNFETFEIGPSGEVTHDGCTGRSDKKLAAEVAMLRMRMEELEDVANSAHRLLNVLDWNMNVFHRRQARERLRRSLAVARGGRVA